MYDTSRCRSGRHVIRGPQDRRSNGGCAACARESEARYRHACQRARRQMAAQRAAV